MNNDDLLLQLLAEQAAHGAFRSVVYHAGRCDVDWNTFASAQVLRALYKVRGCVTLAHSSHLRQAQERALDYIRQGEASQRPGYFGFWPTDARPSWIETLSEDADDTAVICLELTKYGRVDIHFLQSIAYKVLIRHRLQRVEYPAPPWLQRGVYLTWLRTDNRPNVIDCCVNTNVVALMAYARLQHLPGFQEACTMIEEGIRWAGQSRMRAQCLVPFYPHPIELRYAIEHAIECGATVLTSSLSLLNTLCWAMDDTNEATLNERPICGSAYGNIVWVSRAVQLARRLASSA